MNPAAMVCRLPVLDEYVEDGRSAVFVNDLVIALSELASSALAHIASAGTSVGELHDLLVAEYGEPEGVSAEDATSDLIDDLGRLGLVTVTDPAALI